MFMMEIGSRFCVWRTRLQGHGMVIIPFAQWTATFGFGRRFMFMMGSRFCSWCKMWRTRLQGHGIAAGNEGQQNAEQNAAKLEVK